jgi:hypothetical protein
MPAPSTSGRPRAPRPVRFGLIVAAGAVLATGGCQTLDVVNLNSPAITGVFSNAENIESALIGGWRAWWGVAQGSGANNTSPVLQLSVLGNELTTADAFPMQVTAEPRPEIDNRNQGGWHNRKPWYDMYRVIATGRDVLVALRVNQLRLGAITAAAPEGEDTPRAVVFSHFLIGLGNIYLGLLFDQCFPADENDDPEVYRYVLQPYTACLEKGRASLRTAIQLARAAPDFTLPTTWINGNPLTRDQLVRVMYSFLARSYAYEARTPAQRQATNWNRVIGLLDSGITTNLVQQADNTIAATASAYVQYSFLQTNGRTNTRLLGPADTSGNYQRWLTTPLDQRDAILIYTPDRRISNTTVSASAQPAPPVKFARPPSQTMTTVRGTYMRSNYLSTTFRTPPTLNYHQIGLIRTMTVDEMKYIRAEALYRLNRRAEVPALLNPTRVAAGLQPVTVDGPPAGPLCVPRKDDGSCGDLWDALMYEKRIDLFPTEAIIAFVDQRGWGRLLTGTPLHFPVHGRELETLGLPYYTLGGSGEGSAP